MCISCSETLYRLYKCTSSLFIFVGCSSQLDVAFILDASGSVEDKFIMEQNLTTKIIQGLNFVDWRTRVGVITYQVQEKSRPGGHFTFCPGPTSF